MSRCYIFTRKIAVLLVEMTSIQALILSVSQRGNMPFLGEVHPGVNLENLPCKRRTNMYTLSTKYGPGGNGNSGDGSGLGALHCCSCPFLDNSVRQGGQWGNASHIFPRPGTAWFWQQVGNFASLFPLFWGAVGVIFEGLHWGGGLHGGSSHYTSKVYTHSPMGVPKLGIGGGGGFALILQSPRMRRNGAAYSLCLPLVDNPCLKATTRCIICGYMNNVQPVITFHLSITSPSYRYLHYVSKLY